MTPLREAMAASQSAANRLGDGRRSRRYPDLPADLDGVIGQLTRAGVTTEACVALECRNDLPAVTVLLALLDGGFHVLLHAGEPRPPRFCRYRVAAGDEAGAVDVRESRAWNGALLSDLPPSLWVCTSGSTGEPRIAVHAHDVLWANGRACVERFRLTSADRVAIPVPIWHMYGLGAALLPAVAAGASVDVLAGANVLTLLEQEQRFDPDVVFLTPGLCSALNRVRKAPRPSRLTVTAGDRLPEDDARRYEELHGALVNLYGSTELGAIAAGSPDDPPEVRWRTAGRPMAGVEVTAPRRAAAGRATAPGELRIRHRNGYSGFADVDGRPVTPPDEGRGHPTRDLAIVRGDGTIEILGRLDHQVKRDGRLVAFSVVERALSELAEVDRAAVIAAGTGPRGAHLIAWCSLHRGTEVDEKALRRRLLGTLPKYALPDRVVIVPELPLLRSGKVDRPQLVRWLEEGPRGLSPRDPPRDG